jgi:collagenase-like PrtC family protease
MMTIVDRHISLTMGPLLFNWPIEKWRDFYARLADEAPVDTVHLGEVVCSKRLPFYIDAIPEAVGRLQRGGKTVVFGTLALTTLMRERKDSINIVRNDVCEVEVNDIAALAHLREGQAFRTGPYVNVYNESTLRFLAHLGTSSVCLPPELPIDSVKLLGGAARSLHVGCEVWSFGRVPLAISGRCYHARLEGLTKDSCQFVCARDPDGLAVDTVDGEHFLAINGVQTMSHTYCNTIRDVTRLLDADVTALRLSPHSCDMVAIARTFRDRLDGALGTDEAMRRIEEICKGATFSNGFLFGKAGAEMAPQSGIDGEAAVSRRTAPPASQSLL